MPLVNDIEIFYQNKRQEWSKNHRGIVVISSIKNKDNEEFPHWFFTNFDKACNFARNINVICLIKDLNEQ